MAISITIFHILLNFSPNTFVRASIAIWNFSLKPIAIPINANQTIRSNVISSDQKKTKLNSFLVTTCSVTINVISASAIKQIHSKIESSEMASFLSFFTFYIPPVSNIVRVFKFIFNAILFRFICNIFRFQPS